MQFQYRSRQDHQYPIVPITVSHGEKKLRTEGLIDSGASFSVFSADIAEYLELPLETGSVVHLSGIGGRILGYRHEINLAVETVTFRAVVVFSADFISSFNLLGRDNFFEQFRITFDEKQSSVDLDPVRNNT